MQLHVGFLYVACIINFNLYLYVHGVHWLFWIHIDFWTTVLVLLEIGLLRTVPTIVIAHMFCAS